VTGAQELCSRISPRTLVAVDAVLALDTGLAGRPVEARPALAHAGAIHAIQTDPVPEAHVLVLPGAGLALGAEEAGTARSGLQQKDKAGHTLHLLLGGSWGLCVYLLL
jgi:hypothetical protein